MALSETNHEFEIIDLIVSLPDLPSADTSPTSVCYFAFLPESASTAASIQHADQPSPATARTKTTSGPATPRSLRANQ